MLLCGTSNRVCETPDSFTRPDPTLTRSKARNDKIKPSVVKGKGPQSRNVGMDIYTAQKNVFKLIKGACTINQGKSAAKYIFSKSTKKRASSPPFLRKSGPS